VWKTTAGLASVKPKRVVAHVLKKRKEKGGRGTPSGLRDRRVSIVWRKFRQMATLKPEKEKKNGMMNPAGSEGLRFGAVKKGEKSDSGGNATHWATPHYQKGKIDRQWCPRRKGDDPDWYQYISKKPGEIVKGWKGGVRPSREGRR